MAGEEAQVGKAYGDRLRAAFDELVEVKSEERRAFVEARFADDADVRQELLGMLQHLDAETSFIEPLEPDVLKGVLDWTNTDPESSGPRLRTLTGEVIAERYSLTRLLGSGGAGVVYEAEDRLGGANVAVKILRNDTGEGRLDRRWEATTLRLLRVPGVVQLLDEGESDGLVYLVTDLVEGEPFPGRPSAITWAEIEETVLALLETLDRVHWAGIVHRDLKPGNVLVDERGRPHVLDLGIAQEREGRKVEGTRGSRRGTLGYMAPEQLRGEPATARSDLYSVGVMLHETLAGARYRSESSVRLARFGLISERPKDVDELPGDVPEFVRRVLTSLLQPDSSQRPGSAREVLDALLEHDAHRRATREMPFVGRAAELESVLRSARAGRSLDVAGAPGSGRTRLLREAEKHLSREGRETLHVDSGKTVAEITAAVEAAHARGAIVFVGGETEPDARVHAFLEAARRQGPVVRVVEAGDAPALHLAPLTETDLQGVFSGPDRLLHLKEDGARELWARTRGHPRAISRELDAWSRAGLGWWQGPHYHVRRQDLEVLGRGLRNAPAGSAVAVPAEALREATRDVALVVDLAGPRATAALVSQVLGQHPDWVEAELTALEEAGLLRRTSEGALEPRLPLALMAEFRQDVDPSLHRRIALALEPGDERRLLHWVAAGTLDSVPAESIAVASALLEAGKIDAARGIVREGLRALAHRPDSGWQIQLLELDLLAAFRTGTTRSLDQVLRDLGAIPSNGRVERLERIARGGLRAIGGEPERALDEVPVPDGTASEIEVQSALSVRSFAGRALGSAGLRQVLEEMAPLAAESPHVLARVHSEQAWLDYREGRYAEAAEGHLEAAAGARHAVGRNLCLLNAASAFLEAGLCDRAEALATEALAFARERRLVPNETRAAWLVRSAAYRRGDVLRPDIGLALASTQVGLLQMAAVIHLSEGAIAWRAGRYRLAERLARRAAGTMIGEPRRWPRLIASALALASSRQPDEAEARHLLGEARACPSARLAIQAAGLLARVPTTTRAEARTLAGSRLARIPASERDLRREILSADEAVKSPAPERVTKG